MRSESESFSHQLRNLAHSLNMLVSGLGLEQSQLEELEWLDAIERTAEEAIETIDRHLSLDSETQVIAD